MRLELRATDRKPDSNERLTNMPLVPLGTFVDNKKRVK